MKSPSANRAAVKARYHRRLAAGLCGGCGARPRAPKSQRSAPASRCAACLASYRVDGEVRKLRLGSDA